VTVAPSPVDFNGNGIAGCALCGLRFVPTFRHGRRVQECPRCDGDRVTAEVEAELDAETRAALLPKVGRNAPCPCGSGTKYKKCCGR
jgi:preprotein translocase subunit SecA